MAPESLYLQGRHRRSDAEGLIQAADAFLLKIAEVLPEEHEAVSTTEDGENGRQEQAGIEAEE